MTSQISSTKHLKKSLPITHKLFHKIEDNGKLLNSFYKTCITLVTKPDKDITHKKEVQIFLQMVREEIHSKFYHFNTTILSLLLFPSSLHLCSHSHTFLESHHGTSALFTIEHFLCCYIALIIIYGCNIIHQTRLSSFIYHF